MAAVDLLGLLGDTVLRHDSEGNTNTVPVQDLRGKTVGLYFSAHWCPPCRQFTPLLTQTYNKLRAEGKEFEVVFVSSDKEVQHFENYFGQMPWAAVPFEDAATRRRLSAAFRIMGIPSLIMVGPDGRVLTTNGRSAVMRDHGGTNYPWEGAQGGREGILGSPFILLLLFIAFWKLAQWVMGLWRD